MPRYVLRHYGTDLKLQEGATLVIGRDPECDLRIEDAYIPDMNQRLSAYRRMASARSFDELTALLEELGDRYGPPPLSVGNLAALARIRLLADRVGIETLDREGSVVVLRFRQDAKVDPVRLLKLVERREDLSLLPPAVLKLDLARPEQLPAHSGKQTGAPLLPTRPGAPTLRRKGKANIRAEDQSSSWWTARATAGEVSPGFSRDVILAKPALDPAAPGGLFDRLGQVLSELSDSLVQG